MKAIYSSMKQSLAVISKAALAATLILTLFSCGGSRKAPADEPVTKIITNSTLDGYELHVQFRKGSAHNHPLMAVWIADTAGRYLQTLYVAQSIGKGIFQHGLRSSGQWLPGPIRRPAALPYWSHSRGVQAPDGYFLPTPDDPLPDAITGPTPSGNFDLVTRTERSCPRRFILYFEINQSWDWNEYWTNARFPGDEHYLTSSQPALVFAANIDASSPQEEYSLVPVGHSHYSGANGNLYPDLETLTTALKIADEVKVKIIRNN